MGKEKLTYDELINNLEEKGVTFNIIGKDEAKEYLRKSCYYFKLASYRKNYDKNKIGKYVGLDFAHLVKLSKIDRDLRYVIMNLCLDIEHELRVRVADIMVRLTDGIDPVKNFISQDRVENDDQMNAQGKTLQEIMVHKSPYYNKELIEKYCPDFPIWTFLEIISFGTLCRFIEFIHTEYDCYVVDTALLNRIRILRNAVAHNNCLLRNLRENARTFGKINGIVAKECKSINSEQRNRKLKNRFVIDFVCLLIMHHTLVDGKTKLNRLNKLIYETIPSEKDYFIRNTLLVSSFNFVKKVLDSLIS